MNIEKILDWPLTKIFIHPVTKGILLTGGTVWISYCTNMYTGALTDKGLRNTFLGSAFGYLLIVILYQAAEYIATKKQKKLHAKAIKQHYRIEDYKIMVKGIESLLSYCAQYTNIQIHEINDHNRLDFRVWNFCAASVAACKTVYEGIIKNSYVRMNHDDKASPNIAVSYVLLDERSQTEEDKDRGNLIISLSGYYHPSKSKSNSLGVKRKVADLQAKKYYAKLFADDIDSPKILYDNDDVKREMGGQCTYEQYIAIPVRCITIDNTSKLVGMLVIACDKGNPVSTDRDELDYLKDCFFPLYAHLFLSLFKLDKALRAGTKSEIEEGEKNGEE